MKVKFILASLFLVFLLSCQESNNVLDPNNQENNVSLNKVSATYSSDTYLIDGKIGGKIKVTHNWKNENGKNSKLKAVLDIPKNAFIGTKEFSMVFNLDHNSVDLYPSPSTFDKPLLLSLKLKNVNVPYADLDFKYLDGDEEVLYDENIVDTKLGNLEVKKAQLNHFSQWGWSR
ncbi:MAG: hypothetical protein IPM32_16465 [Ignavibacteriae bacterium]|nr:hypothetical protein [Ignavibacteriota bacterium]